MLYSYKNWDVTINIFSDWTKEIIWDWNITYPISMDVKEQILFIIW